MRRRAQQVAETRARIVAAAVELHAGVGPARTTIAEIARRAGVERLTVYHHFPDDRALFGACQARWLADAPPPDPMRHATIADPDVRLKAVLRDLYAWYRRGEAVLRNVIRDAETLPALQQTLRAQREAVTQTVELLLKGRRVGGNRRRRLAAALALVVGFGTWDTLTSAGLTDVEAANVAAAMVRGAN
ncbi:MAG: TetR/AcrR family transcriptional regulator [Candidatus Limnocylindria bacterium]